MTQALLTLGILATAYLYYKASVRHCLAMRRINEVRNALKR
jgi:hypothetical protein